MNKLSQLLQTITESLNKPSPSTISLIKQVASDRGHKISNEQAIKANNDILNNLGWDHEDDGEGQDYYDALKEYFN